MELQIPHLIKIVILHILGIGFQHLSFAAQSIMKKVAPQNYSCDLETLANHMPEILHICLWKLLMFKPFLFWFHLFDCGDC